MARILDQLKRSLSGPLGWLDLAVVVVIGLCVLAVFTAVLIDFAEYHGRPRAKTVRRSIVDTASMTAFFIGLYALIRLRIMELHIPWPAARITMVVAGLVVIVLGCWVNIAGRLRLGRNWANQVTIYDDQKLVTAGVYGFVRHPLYASLVWMFYGACLVYANLSAVLATTLVFVPFMYYRAGQEEALLEKEFPGYPAYRSRVGMFFPKWR